MSDVDLDAVEARYNAIAAYAVPEAMQAGPLPDDVIWRTAELLRDAAADVPVLAAELRQSRAGLAEARRLMAVDFDRARKAEDALAVEAERLRAALALQAEYDTAQREVERLRSLPAIDPDAYHEARAAIARVEALHQRYRPPHRDDVDICPECSQFPVDVPLRRVRRGLALRHDPRHRRRCVVTRVPLRLVIVGELMWRAKRFVECLLAVTGRRWDR